MNRERKDYVQIVTRWIIDASVKDDGALDEAVRGHHTLDGVYRGKSARIHRLIRIAYLRGVQRGASCAWESQQPITLRNGVEGEGR